MKKLYIILFSVIVLSVITSGQSVISPSARSYSTNTANQDASGFSVTGFGSSENLLISIGLINQPTGTTLRLAYTSGVTASTGYNLTSNFTRISFTGTQANVNAVLASLQVSTGSVAGNITISVSGTVNPVGYYYLPTNGHFYRPMTWPSDVSGGDEAYNTIKSRSASQSFKGQSGYLVTITSSDEQDFIFNNVPGSNILIALTDRSQEGVWKWDAGPEAGTIIRNGNTGGTNVSGQYNNWCSGEPNEYAPGEDYAVTKWDGNNCWNDFGPPATQFPGSTSGYVVEFGTWSDPSQQNFTEFYTGSVTSVSCTTPGTPTGLSGIATGTATANLTWSPGSPSGSSQVTYEWQVYTSGGTLVTSSTTTSTSTSVSGLSANTSYYFRVRAYTTCNNTYSSWSSNSSNFTTYPANPVSVTVNLGTTICQGTAITLTANGSQGTVFWYSGSCGGTFIGQGDQITLSPSATTTYYARNYNSAGFSSGCASITITVNPLLRYRSKNSGNWTDPANWEQYNGTAWVTAGSHPGQISNNCPDPQVTIKPGHIMTLNEIAITIPNLTIEGNGKVEKNRNASLTISNNLVMSKNSAGGIQIKNMP